MPIYVLMFSREFRLSSLVKMGWRGRESANHHLPIADAVSCLEVVGAQNPPAVQNMGAQHVGTLLTECEDVFRVSFGLKRCMFILMCNKRNKIRKHFSRVIAYRRLASLISVLPVRRKLSRIGRRYS
jgi:hypothetical protein